MWRILGTLLSKLTKGLGKQVLVSLGLGLATGAATMAVVSFYVNKIIQQAGFMGDMAAILHLGGMDVAISIVIGAVVTRASLSMAKVSLTKAK